MNNNYYVYYHRDTEDTIVYVGKGRYSRAWRHERRNLEHSNWMSEQLPFLKVEIVCSNLSELEAFSKEKELIQELQPKYNSDYTLRGYANRKEFGAWLNKNHSRFHDSELQKELGKRAAQSANHPNNKLFTCEHCNATMNLGHIKRYHNDNCKKRITTNDSN